MMAASLSAGMMMEMRVTGSGILRTGLLNKGAAAA